MEYFSKSFHKGFRRLFFPSGYIVSFPVRKRNLKRFLSDPEDQFPISDKYVSDYNVTLKKKKPFIYLVGFQPGQTVYIYGNIEQHVGLKKHPHRGCRRYFPLSWILQRFERALCGPMDCSPRGSSGHGILQERLLEWLAISSRGSSQPRDSILVS